MVRYLINATPVKHSIWGEKTNGKIHLKPYVMFVELQLSCSWRCNEISKVRLARSDKRVKQECFEVFTYLSLSNEP